MKKRPLAHRRLLPFFLALTLGAPALAGHVHQLKPFDDLSPGSFSSHCMRTLKQAIGNILPGSAAAADRKRIVKELARVNDIAEKNKSVARDEFKLQLRNDLFHAHLTKKILELSQPLAGQPVALVAYQLREATLDLQELLENYEIELGNLDLALANYFKFEDRIKFTEKWGNDPWDEPSSLSHPLQKRQLVRFKNSDPESFTTTEPEARLRAVQRNIRTLEDRIDQGSAKVKLILTKLQTYVPSPNIALLFENYHILVDQEWLDYETEELKTEILAAKPNALSIDFAEHLQDATLQAAIFRVKKVARERMETLYGQKGRLEKLRYQNQHLLNLEFSYAGAYFLEKLALPGRNHFRMIVETSQENLSRSLADLVESAVSYSQTKDETAHEQKPFLVR